MVVEPVRDVVAADTDDVYRAVIAANGGTITVDVRSPNEPPRAVLDDPYWAQTWLASVYGPQIATHVSRFEDPDDNARIEDWAHVDRLTRVVGLLGVAFWLHRWWPADWIGLGELAEDLLEVEVAGLSWIAEAVLVDLEPVRNLVEPHAALVADQVEALLVAPDHALGEELRVLVAALRAVVDLVDADAPGYQSCAEMLADPRLEARLRARETEDPVAAGRLESWAATVAATVRRVLPRPGLGTPVSQATRGDQSVDAVSTASDASTYRDPVDWRQVPPRMISTANPRRNVTTVVTPRGVGVDLQVGVDAAWAWRDRRDVSLHARVYDQTSVPVVLALTFSEKAGRFEGSVSLDHPLDLPLRVDVFSMAYAGRPRITDDARAVATDERQRRVELITERQERSSTADLLLTEQVMRAAREGPR